MRKRDSNKLLGHDYFSEEHDGSTIYKPGFSFMKRFDEKYRKVKVQSIVIKSVKRDYHYENDVYIEYSFLENKQVSVPHVEKLDHHKFWARSIQRCWKFSKVLNEEVMDYCKKCGWIICPED
jgi:hypothetical protein